MVELAETQQATDFSALQARYDGLSGSDLLRPMMEREFHRKIALVSSFGTEAAVLLALAAEIDPGIPVIFLDTGKLFGETLRYRDTLIKQLGLTDVRTIEPDPVELKAADPEGLLWQSSPDACCHVRKTIPLERALKGFDAWITGRKRFQASTRAALSGCRTGRGRQDQGQPAGILVARPDRGGVRKAAGCPAIRWKPTASCRSAACPAPTGSLPDRTPGPAVGPGSTRPSAASTCPPRHATRHLFDTVEFLK